MVFLLQQTIYCAIPLLIVALAGVFSERSGIINLALEGEMIFGAFIGAIVVKVIVKAEVAFFINNPQLLFLLAMLCSAVAGGAFSLLLSFSAIKFKADQTIGGTALNLLAPAIVSAIGLLFFMEEQIKPNFTSFILLKSSYGPGMNNLFSSKVGWFFELLFDRMYISSYICIFLFVILSIWLYKSKVGTHMRACGEHPQAADSVGINVYKMRYLGTTISGCLAGLGGYVYIATNAAGIAGSSVAGTGFLALAIMIFGNWNPLFIAIGALLFGFLRCLGATSSTIPFLANWNLPVYFYNIVPYFIVLVVLVITRNKSGCPKAEGIPYDKGMR